MSSRILYNLQIEVEPLEEGGYLATSPILPGFLVESETTEEAIQEAPIVAQALLETLNAMDKSVPLGLEPIGDSTPHT